MKLPNAVKCIGKTDGRQRIYVEDYALQYLKYCRKMAEENPDGEWDNRQFAVYGYYEREAEAEYYVIYILLPGTARDAQKLQKTDQESRMEKGICPLDIKETGAIAEERGCRRGRSFGGSWKQIADTAETEDRIQGYRYLGDIRLKQDPVRGRVVCSFCSRYSGEEIAGGYSVFYDENHGMKEYLGQYAEQQKLVRDHYRQTDFVQAGKKHRFRDPGRGRGFSKSGSGRTGTISSSDRKENGINDHGRIRRGEFCYGRRSKGRSSHSVSRREGVYSGRNHKVSKWLCREYRSVIRQGHSKAGDEGEACSVYLPIRVAVLGLLMIICVLAVTTVNDYERLHDFVKKAVYTNEIIEEAAGEQHGKDQRISSVQEGREY